MFENGDRHKQLKSFLIAISQNMLRMGRLIPNIMDIIPEHLIKWNFKEGKYIILQFFCDETRSTPCSRDTEKLFRNKKVNERIVQTLLPLYSLPNQCRSRLSNERVAAH